MRLNLQVKLYPTKQMKPTWILNVTTADIVGIINTNG